MQTEFDTAAKVIMTLGAELHYQLQNSLVGDRKDCQKQHL